MQKPNGKIRVWYRRCLLAAFHHTLTVLSAIADALEFVSLIPQAEHIILFARTDELMMRDSQDKLPEVKAAAEISKHVNPLAPFQRFSGVRQQFLVLF